MNRIFTLLIALCYSLVMAAQQVLPTATPTMTYVDEDGAEVSESQYDGSAPFKATFKAGPENVAIILPFTNGVLPKQETAPPFWCAMTKILHTTLTSQALTA